MAQTGDSQSPPADGTSRPPLPCQYCQVPVTQPKRWDRVKRFCSDRHRVAHHTQERRRAVLEVLASLEALEDELERSRAVVVGARQRITATLPKERTKKTT